MLVCFMKHTPFCSVVHGSSSLEAMPLFTARQPWVRQLYIACNYTFNCIRSVGRQSPNDRMRLELCSYAANFSWRTVPTAPSPTQLIVTPQQLAPITARHGLVEEGCAPLALGAEFPAFPHPPLKRRRCPPESPNALPPTRKPAMNSPSAAATADGRSGCSHKSSISCLLSTPACCACCDTVRCPRPPSCLYR